LMSNARWTAGNVVLIGDALRTGHFSIGSGTRLAFDDAIALDRALGEAGDDVPALLAAFERERRPVVDKLVAAANSSSYWYERMADKMALDPVELAYDYMTRSGRVDDTRLREMAPVFMRDVEAARPFARQGIVDPVPRDAPGAQEIAFSVPDRYNASSLLYDNLGRAPDKVALVCGERTLSYAALAALADKAGAGMRSMGLARGGRVLMLLDDTPEYVAAIFGALRAGFVPVLVNTLSPPELVAYYLSDSGAEAAFVDARFASLLSHDDVSATRLRQVVHVGDLAQGALPHQRMCHEWNDWIAVQRDVLEPADTHRDDMAFWMYSSGSTGRPKGVVHLHHDALYTWRSYGERVLGLRADDVVFSPPKIFFAYGFGNSITFPFAAGATTVLMPGRPEAEAVFTTIERHRPTVLFGLPTLYVAMAALAGSESRDLSSLRLCLSAAETLSSELFNEWQRRYGLAIVEGLGSTEVLHIYLSNSPSQQKPGASGKRVPGYELRLTDPDGRDVAEGESGILWVRGDSQAPCYWRRPDKTAETMRDGWIYTGDRFRRDADGFHFFEGRADDLVKVSGQWVLPLEVERCLAECPLVRECVVLALEDANRLTTLAAFVALHDASLAGAATTRELQRFVKSRLVPYKYPREVLYLPELPKTGTGKIDRQALKTR
jgi:benzoate-CoA ligase family protein